jgi:hypothetical protein
MFYVWNLHLFNPSSTTFVKHFIAEANCMQIMILKFLEILLLDILTQQVQLMIYNLKCLVAT